MSIGVPLFFNDRIAYMSTLSERLEELMKANPEFTQANIARGCGVKQPSVNDWLSGRTKRMRGEVLLKAAAFFQVDEQWLATGKGDKYKCKNISPESSDNKQVIDVSDMSLEKVNALEMIAKKIKGMREEEVPDAVLGFNATTNALEDRRRKESNKRNEGNTDKN